MGHHARIAKRHADYCYLEHRLRSGMSSLTTGLVDTMEKNKGEMMIWLLAIPILWLALVNFSNYRFNRKDHYIVWFTYGGSRPWIGGKIKAMMSCDRGGDPNEEAWKMAAKFNNKYSNVRVRSITKMKAG